MCRKKLKWDGPETVIDFSTFYSWKRFFFTFTLYLEITVFPVAYIAQNVRQQRGETEESQKRKP